MGKSYQISNGIKPRHVFASFLLVEFEIFSYWKGKTIDKIN